MRMGEGPLFGNDFRTSNARSWPDSGLSSIQFQEPRRASFVSSSISHGLLRGGLLDGPRDRPIAIVLAWRADPYSIPLSRPRSLAGSRAEHARCPLGGTAAGAWREPEARFRGRDARSCASIALDSCLDSFKISCASTKTALKASATDWLRFDDPNRARFSLAIRMSHPTGARNT